MKLVMKDRYLGCLVGLAVGDALGAPIEWKKTFRPVAGMRINKRQIGSRFGVTKKAGHHTDDTSMALCLAQSLIDKKGFNAQDQLEKYLKWMDEGYMSSNGKCEGMGKTTREALNNFRICGHLITKVSDEKVCGNGSIMRLAPIAMFYNNPLITFTWARLSSKTTHIHPECIDACGILGEMIAKALNGQSKEEIFNTSFSKYNLPDGIEIKKVIENKTYLNEPPYIKGSGHVVKSLEAALWAFHKSTNFKDGVLLAVNLGEDADTTAAIYGQLAGAYYGYNNIPKVWRDKLVKKTLIKKTALSLYKLVNGKATEGKKRKETKKGAVV